MIQRSKTRYFILLIILFCIVVGVVGGTYWLKRRDPDRYERRGDLLRDSQKYGSAFGQYAHAMSLADRPAAKAKLLKKMAACLTEQVPRDLEKALEHSLRAMGMLEYACTFAPRDDALTARVLDAKYQLASLTGAAQAWNELYAAANSILTNHPSSEAAAAYKLAAAANMFLHQGSEFVEAGTLLDDFRTLQTRNQDRYLVRTALAAAFLKAAVDAENQQQREYYRQTALSMFSERAPAALGAADEIDIARLRTHMEHDFIFPDNAVQPDIGSQIRETADRLMMGSLTESGMEFVRLIAAMLQRGLTGRYGFTENELLDMADRLIAEMKQVRPGDLELLMVEARIRTYRGDMPGALEIYRRIRDVESTAAGLVEPRRHWLLKSAAAVQGVEGLLSELSRTGDPDTRLEQLAAAEDALNAANALVAATNTRWAMHTFYRGKLNFEWGDYRAALDRFHEFQQVSGAELPEVKLYIGLAFRRLGEKGSAERQLRLLLDSPEGTETVRERAVEALIGVLLDQEKYDEARALLSREYAGRDTARNRAVQLSRVLLTASRNRPGAQADPRIANVLNQIKDALNPFVEAGDAEAILLYADAEELSGNSDAAEAILLDCIKQQPEQDDVLVKLVRLNQARGKIENAIQLLRNMAEKSRHLPAAQLLLAKLDASEESNMAECLLLARLVLLPDPIMQRLGLAGYLFRQRQPEKAAALLTAAAELRANDTRIFEVQMQRHLMSDDIEAAEALLDSARINGVREATLFYYQAQLDYAAHRPYRAKQHTQTAVELDRDCAQAWYFLSRICSDLSFDTQAYAACQRALDVDPYHAQALTHLHRLQDAAGEKEKARQTLQKAARALRTSGRLIADYISYEAVHGDRERALKIRKKIAESEPQNEANLRSLADVHAVEGDLDQAEAILRKLYADGRERQANAAALAEFLRTAESEAAAIKFVTEHIEDSGHAATSADYLLQARLLRICGRDEAATESFKQACSKADGTAQRLAATHEFAAWLRASGKRHDALQMYERVWQEQPDSVTARILVDLCIEMRLFSKGQQFLSAAEERWGRGFEMDILAARLAAAWGKREDALRLFEDLTRRYPEDPRPYFQRAVAFYRTADSEIEKRVHLDLETVLRINPHLVRAREYLARWHEESRNFQETIHHVRLLIRERPRRVSYRAWLAQLYLKVGDLSALETFLSESKKLLPHEAVWYDLSADLHAAQERYGNALSEQLRALGHQPNMTRLAAAIDTLLRLNEIDEAMNLLKYHDSLAVTSPVRFALKGRILMRRGEKDAGLAAFSDSLRNMEVRGAPVDAVARHLHQGLHMPELIELAENSEHTFGYTGWFTLARAYQLEGDHQRALDTFSFIRNRMPSHHALYSAVLRRQALSYLMTSQFDNAAAVYRRLRDREPDSPLLLNNLAVQLAEMPDQADEAIELAETALQMLPQRSPFRAPILDTLGLAHLNRGNFESALFALTRSLALEKSPETYMHLGVLSAKREENQQADDYFQLACEAAYNAKRPDSLQRCLSTMKHLRFNIASVHYENLIALYLRANMGTAAENALAEALVEKGYQQALLIQQAEFLFQSQRRDELRKTIRMIINRHGADMTSRAWLQLARACRRFALPEQANSIYPRAYATSWDQADAAKLEHAEWLCQSGDVQAGIDLARDIARQTGQSNAYLALIDMLLQVGELDEAERECEQAQKRVPLAELRLREARLAIECKQPEKAAEILQYALAIAPMHVNLMLEYARLQLTTGTYEGEISAEKALRQVIARDPGNRPARKLLTRVCKQQLRYVELAEHLQALLYDNPVEMEHVVTLGNAYRKAGDYEQLAQHLAWSRGLYPENVTLRILQAELMRHRDELDAALALLKKVTEETMEPTAFVAFAELCLASDRLDYLSPQMLAAARQSGLGNSPVVLAVAGRIHYTIGNKGEAFTLFAQAYRVLHDAPPETAQSIREHCLAQLSVLDVVELVRACRKEGVPAALAAEMAERLCRKEADQEVVLSVLTTLNPELADSPYEIPFLKVTADVYAQAGQWQQGLQLLRHQLKRHRKSARVQEAIANVMMNDKGAWAEARGYAQAAVNLAPQEDSQLKSRSLHTLGRIQSLMGLVHPARLSFAQSIDFQETVMNRWDLARLLLEEGQPRAAIYELNRALFLARAGAQTKAEAEIKGLLARAETE